MKRKIKHEHGVLLVATQHPYYGKMAYNLAASIKVADPEVKIAVLHSGDGLSHLREHHKKMFDEIIELKGPVTGTAAKLLLDKYTPFQKTLFIDADNLWLPKKKTFDLFKQLEGVKFTAITEGYFDTETFEDKTNPYYTMWFVDTKEAIEKYELAGKLYQWRSEVMYFEHGAADGFWKTVRDIYNSPQVKIDKFAGALPDEFAINIAAAIHGIEPHEYKWKPAYWAAMHGQIHSAGQLFEDYWLLSTGGNNTNQTTGKLYDSIVREAHYKLRLQNSFKLQSKRTTIAERRYL